MEREKFPGWRNMTVILTDNSEQKSHDIEKWLHLFNKKINKSVLSMKRVQHKNEHANQCLFYLKSMQKWTCRTRKQITFTRTIIVLGRLFVKNKRAREK